MIQVRMGWCQGPMAADLWKQMLAEGKGVDVLRSVRPLELRTVGFQKPRCHELKVPERTRTGKCLLERASWS